MNREQAHETVRETFTQAFDKARFKGFCLNLLNGLDETKAFTRNTTYIKQAFRSHVHTFERLGTYTSPEGETLDVLIAHLTDEQKLVRARTAIRNFIADHLKLRDNKDAALVAFVSPAEKQWRFSYVRMDYTTVVKSSGKIGIETRLTPAKRFSYIVGEGESCHTAQTRFLDLLQDAEKDPTLEDIEAAFSVETVTRDFYKQYAAQFEAAKEQIDSLNEEDTHLFVQTLFNRLMFLRFVERKGWLSFDGTRDYLRALFRAGGYRGESFYRGRLRRLFFSGLAVGGEQKHEAIGTVPFLNGGLFEENDLDRRVSDIPDSVFAPILGEDGLFYRFNFTVEESTPLDVDVAVDPEMLGRVFEELVTGRHDSGSYYTPREIVSFMCREALKGYLQTAVPSEKREAVADFVDRHDAHNLQDPEAVLSALRRVTACDPACGSGAYLLGMLHELFELRECLFTSRKLDPENAYKRKLTIIQQNLYGVDIAEFAVNIARLRLWLSLAVEFDGDTPPPLPNLDFKIEVGDSVLAPDPAKSLTHAIGREQLSRYVNLKQKFLDAHGPEKQALARQIGEIRTDLRKYEETTRFDWAVDFAEVFFAPRKDEATLTGAMAGIINTTPGQLEMVPDSGRDPGFDVVLANPPYVRQELIKEIKPALNRVYGHLYSGTADLYVYFYYRAVQLLRKGGMLAFISSNKWFRADYGKALRAYMAKETGIWNITDFGELPVFTAATFPMVITAQKGVPSNRTRFTQVKSLDPPYPDIPSLIAEQGFDLPEDAIDGEHWMLAPAGAALKLKKMRAAGIPLGEYVNGKIFYGIKTGFNKAFIIDGAKRAELIAQDPNNAEIIKPLAVGDDIRKWHIRRADKWLIVTRIGVDMKRYPAVLAHLRQWQEKLEERWDKGNHWWELRPCDYYAEFEKPKIIYPEIAKESRFAYDVKGIYPIKTTFSIPLEDLYLLGILNSASAWDFLKSPACCSVLGDADNRGRLTLQETFVSKLPIPLAPESERAAIARLVEECLSREGLFCEAQEAEINERVARLYGLG